MRFSQLLPGLGLLSTRIQTGPVATTVCIQSRGCACTGVPRCVPGKRSPDRWTPRHDPPLAGLQSVHRSGGCILLNLSVLYCSSSLMPMDWICAPIGDPVTEIPLPPASVSLALVLPALALC